MTSVITGCALRSREIISCTLQPRMVFGKALWLSLTGKGWQDVLPGWESPLVGICMVFPTVLCSCLFSLVRHLHWLSVNWIPRFIHWPLWAPHWAPNGPRSSSPAGTPSVSHARHLNRTQNCREAKCMPLTHSFQCVNHGHKDFYHEALHRTRRRGSVQETSSTSCSVVVFLNSVV
jgi:hypothetical protein